MTEFARSLAIVIGINNYQNGIDSLQTAVPDALEIAEILQNTYKYELIHPDHNGGVIVNRYATQDKLKTLLTDILPNKIKPTKRDRLIFYFAGHGIARNSDDEPQGFLVPQDGNLKDRSSLLKMSDLHDWLAELECKHLLVILDCCFAGAFRWASYRKLIPMTEEITKAHYHRFIKFDAWQVLTSASCDQEALEFLNNRDLEPDKKHSPFAEGLIEALQQEKGDLNNDGVIIATELYLYLRDYVEKNSQDRQTPGFFPLKKHDRGEYLFKLPNTPLNLKETPELNQENNPYRGLESFESRHSQLFFGRDEVIEELYRKISNVVENRHQLTVVTGISGSGKSSLVKAGLIPYLQQNQQHQWRIFEPIRPGTDFYAALARVLSQLDSNLLRGTSDTKLFGKQIQNNSSQFVKAINDWSQQNPLSRLLLVIDQFEELITMTPKAELAQDTLKSSWLQKLIRKLSWFKTKFALERTLSESQQWQEFIELLVTILEQCPQLSLVITVRSDFEPRFQDSAFGTDWANARFVVRPMRADELKEAVEKPAYKKALYFEPPELVDRLVDEVSQMPGALPLLSFTLSEMYIRLYEAWRDEGAENRALTVAEDFDREGGVAGALTRKANEIHNRLPDDAHRLTMQRVMLRMVELEGGEVVRRRVLKSELIYPSQEENERVKTVLARLQPARLIVTGTDTESNEPYYEPAHDYLVRGWEKLQVWISKEQDNLRLQSFVTPGAFDWQREQQSQQFLWDNNPRLDLLEQILNSDYELNWLNSIEADFVAKSIKRKIFNTRRNWSIAIAVMLGLSGLTVWALSEQRKAIIDQIKTYRQSSETGLRSDNLSLDTLIQSLQAVKSGKHWLLQTFPPEKQLQEQVTGTLRMAVNLNKEAKRWQIPSGETAQTIFFNQNSRLLLTKTNINNEPAVCVRSIEAKSSETTKQCQKISPNFELTNQGKFSPDGKKIAWIGEGFAGFHVWDWNNQQFYSYRHSNSSSKTTEPVLGSIPLRLLSTRGLPAALTVGQFSFSLDSKSLTFIGNTNTQNERSFLYQWNWENGRVNTLIKRREKISSFEFKPDGNLLLTTLTKTKDEGTTLTLWEQHSSSWEANEFLVEHTGRKINIDYIVISPSGRSLLMTHGGSSSGGALTELWSVGRDTPTVIGNNNSVSNLSYSPDSRLIAVGDDEGTIRFFDQNGFSYNEQLAELKGHQGLVSSLSFSRDGKQLLTVGNDNTIRLWNLNTEVEAQQFGQKLKLPNPVQELSFSPDSKQIATLEAGTIYLRDVSSPQDYLKKFSQKKYHKESELVFNPQGNRLAIVEPNDKGKEGSKSIIYLLDLPSSKVSQLPDEYGSIDSLSFSPDGKQLAIFESVSFRQSTLRLLDLASQQELKTLETVRPSSSIWKSDLQGNQQLLVSVSPVLSHTVDIWDVFSNKQLASLLIGQSIARYRTFSDIDFNDEGNLVTIDFTFGQTKLWDWQSNLYLGLSYDSDSTNTHDKKSQLSPDSSIMAVFGEGDKVELLQLGGVEELEKKGCQQVQDYLKNNPNLSKSDRNLCDGVVPAHLTHFKMY